MLGFPQNAAVEQLMIEFQNNPVAARGTDPQSSKLIFTIILMSISLIEFLLGVLRSVGRAC